MNFGTKVRTALAIATALNTALLATDITGFNSPTLDTIYKAASVVLNFIIVALVTYYNNDYTEEACKATGYMRWLKQVNRDDSLDGLQDEPETDSEDDRLEGEHYE